MIDGPNNAGAAYIIGATRYVEHHAIVGFEQALDAKRPGHLLVHLARA